MRSDMRTRGRKNSGPRRTAHRAPALLISSRRSGCSAGARGARERAQGGPAGNHVCVSPLWDCIGGAVGAVRACCGDPLAVLLQRVLRRMCVCPKTASAASCHSGCIRGGVWVKGEGSRDNAVVCGLSQLRMPRRQLAAVPGGRQGSRPVVLRPSLCMQAAAVGCSPSLAVYPASPASPACLPLISACGR